MQHKIDVYLAGPYSWHGDPQHKRSAEHTRYTLLTNACAKILENGITCFSPISHSHPMLDHATLPGDWAFWQRMDRAIMTVCRELWVLCVAGWEESEGVKREVEMAKELGMVVVYINDKFTIDWHIAQFNTHKEYGK